MMTQTFHFLCFGHLGNPTSQIDENLITCEVHGLGQELPQGDGDIGSCLSARREAIEMRDSKRVKDDVLWEETEMLK